MIVTGCY